MKYTFWIGRLDGDELELWMEFFEPLQALEWKRKHFAREKDVVCVEHHESGKLSSSIRKTIDYCPAWADGDNWRVICDDSLRAVEIIKKLNSDKSRRMLEAKRKREAEKRAVAFELSKAKLEAYGMTEQEHKDLTDNLKGDTK